MMNCRHRKNDACMVSIGIAERPVGTTDEDCARCRTLDPPQDVNRLTVSRALATMRANGAPNDQLFATARLYRDVLSPDAQRETNPDAKKLVLITRLCPGDVLTLTAAVESLHATYPGEYVTDVRTPALDIWKHNPHITPVDCDDPDGLPVEMHYPTIHQCNQAHVPFLGGFTSHLAQEIGRPLTLTVNRPCLYLSDDEKSWKNQVHETIGQDVPFWIVNAGVKKDYTTKAWPVEYFQAVVDRTLGHIQWVQVGAETDDHPRLDGVVDLVGKTDHRQLIRLAWHCQGGLGPVTYLQHLCAAWEKPYICLLGGREPVTWTSYPLQYTLHTMGALECCKRQACWESRVVPLDDGDDKNDRLCKRPVLGLRRPVPACMAMIKPDDVIQLVERLAA